MKEENNDVSKKNWRRIFRKKWFFPAMYLTIAAVLLTVVIWYQSLDNQLPEIADEDPDEESYVSSENDDVESVMEQQETFQMPIEDADQAEIVTKFYDYNADEEDQEDALVSQDGNYSQSKGIDIKVGDDESFDVLASLSGEVYEEKFDPLLGNVVVLSHDNDVMTYYASLEELSVEEGDEVKQGDVIGEAGNNVIGKENGTHVHFEIRKDDQPVNPETYFNQPLSKLDQANDDEEADPTEENELDPTEDELDPEDPTEEDDLDPEDPTEEDELDPEEDDEDPTDEEELDPTEE